MDQITQAVMDFHKNHTEGVSTTTAFLLGYERCRQDLLRSADRCAGIRVVAAPQKSPGEMTPGADGRRNQ